MKEAKRGNEGGKGERRRKKDIKNAIRKTRKEKLRRGSEGGRKKGRHERKEVTSKASKEGNIPGKDVRRQEGRHDACVFVAFRKQE